MSLRVGGRAARRSCRPGLRRGGGGRQAGATVVSCLVWRRGLAFTVVWKQTAQRATDDDNHADT